MQLNDAKDIDDESCVCESSSTTYWVFFVLLVMRTSIKLRFFLFQTHGKLELRSCRTAFLQTPKPENEWLESYVCLKTAYFWVVIRPPRL